MKTIFKLLLCFTILIVCSGTVNAADNVSTNNENKNLRYVPCPGGGRHQMSSIGIGMLYSGSSQNPGKALFKGPVTQCLGCDIYMISEYYASANSIYTGPGKYKIASSLFVLDGVYALFGGIDGFCYSNMLSDPIIGSFQFVSPYSRNILN